MRAGQSVPRIVKLIGLFLLLSALPPALAQAELQTIDFESGPALGTPLDGAGDISFPTGLGFRPYRTDVGARAHSGTTVGDIGRCISEVEATGGEAGSCEFFQAASAGALARTAKTVTLFAGRFGPVEPGDDAEQAVLIAFDSEGNQLDSTGLVPIDASGFNTPLSVASAAGNIASFRVAVRRGPNGENPNAGDIGIDDLAVNFADGGEPDFSIKTTNQVVAIVQGQSVKVPVNLPRINGSNGPVQISVTGLPTGVTATAAPNPIPGAQATTTLTLVADPSAVDTGFNPVDATVVASPLEASAGSAAHTATLSVRVAADFALSINGISESDPSPPTVELPDCAPVDLPLRVSRDIATQQGISLSVRGPEFGNADLPPGVSAEILPSALVPVGGDLTAERTVRFRAIPNTPLHDRVLIEGRALGDEQLGSRHFLGVELLSATPTARIARDRSGYLLGSTPRYGADGTHVRLEGNGFCPNTSVKVGNVDSVVPATLLDDHTIEFSVPKYATSGPLTIIPPGGREYKTAESLIIDSVRNTDGFQFYNYPLGTISISELTKAFGADDLFLNVNPCWPFGDCKVVTGILSPIAALDWGVLNAEFSAPNSGHCFGMDLAIKLFHSGKESIRQFPGATPHSAAATPFDIPGPDGPGGYLNSFLDALQARNNGQEFIDAWFNRNKRIDDQVDLLKEEFAHHREVDIALLNDTALNSHTLLAYDMTPTPDGFDISVYNSDRPFQAEELELEFRHRQEVDGAVIHLNTVHDIWSIRLFGEVWRGGNGGTFWAIPRNAVPDDPSLPGVGTIKKGFEYLIFGSANGAVRTLTDPGSEFLPALFGSGASNPGAGGASGTIVSRGGDHRLHTSFEGVKSGHYSQAYSTPGFVASANDVATARGVRDVVTGAGDSLTLASGEARSLELKLARQSSPTSTMSATVETHASAGGRDSAGIAADNALTYAHDGAATTLNFSLTAVREDGGPATFVSPPVAVKDGDRLQVKALDRNLGRVRLVVHGANGKRSARVLRNRGHQRRHLELRSLKVSGRRATLRFKLSGVPAKAIVGAAWRLRSGKRVVARKAVALKTANGTRTISWRLPRGVGKGHYRLMADLRAFITGPHGSTALGSVTAHRAAGVVVRAR